LLILEGISECAYMNSDFTDYSYLAGLPQNTQLR
jgi:hypothetical protein